jgi:hypothetical protein
MSHLRHWSGVQQRADAQRCRQLTVCQACCPQCSQWQGKGATSCAAPRRASSELAASSAHAAPCAAPFAVDAFGASDMPTKSVMSEPASEAAWDCSTVPVCARLPAVASPHGQASVGGTPDLLPMVSKPRTLLMCTRSGLAGCEASLPLLPRPRVPQLAERHKQPMLAADSCMRKRVLSTQRRAAMCEPTTALQVITLHSAPNSAPVRMFVAVLAPLQRLQGQCGRMRWRLSAGVTASPRYRGGKQSQHACMGHAVLHTYLLCTANTAS